MKSTWRQLFYWIFAFVEVSVSQVTDNICLTHHGSPGRCVPIRDCPYLFKLVSRPIISAGDRQTLIVNRCGTTGTFCCRTSTVDEALPALMTLPETNDCGLDSNGERIIAGDRTEIDQFRWTVALEYNSPNLKGVKCGGSLINTRYIITAAHCVLKVAPHELTARLGEWDLKTDPDCDEYGNCAEEVRHEKIDRIVIHPEYRSRQNDIALLRLEQELPANYTHFIMPICVPTSTELRSASFSEQNVDATGWEANETGDHQIKMFNKLVTTSLEDCISELQQNLGRTKLDHKHICAKSAIRTDRNTCGIASGSPLQINLDGNYYLIGLMSQGPSCGSTQPTVFTRITPYIDWILENLRE